MTRSVNPIPNPDPNPTNYTYIYSQTGRPCEPEVAELVGVFQVGCRRGGSRKPCL